MKKVLLFVACMAMISCSGCSGNEPEQPEEKEERPVLTDSQATSLAKALYSNMYDLMDKGTMFGAQIPTLYGLKSNNPETSAYFNAFRGCYSEDDFLQFAAKDNVLLENDLPDMYR